MTVSRCVLVTVVLLFFPIPFQPGIAASITYRDRVIYSKGFGTVKKGTAVPPTSQTLFRIASVSKIFVVRVQLCVCVHLWLLCMVLLYVCVLEVCNECVSVCVCAVCVRLVHACINVCVCVHMCVCVNIHTLTLCNASGGKGC